MFDLRDVAYSLNGEAVGGQILCPGPGHGLRDRNLSVRLSATLSHSFIAHSFSGDDPRGYAPGWLMHNYRERFKAWPKDVAGFEPKPPGLKTKQWTRSKQTAFAKARARG